VRVPTLPRALELRVAAVSGVLLATVVSSAVAALAQPPQQPRAAAPVRLVAGDVVPPTPVVLSFAKPQPPSRTPTPEPAPQPSPAATAARQLPASPLCTGDGWRERRGQAAVASLLHQIPAGASLAFLPGRGALKGMTFYDQHRVEVYVGACGRESDALLRHVVAHELGHAWDSLHMTADLRARYLEARGIPAGTPWFGCDRCQDFGTPAGDFAETYAQWQRGVTSSRSTLARAATPAELSRLAAFFQD